MHWRKCWHHFAAIHLELNSHAGLLSRPCRKRRSSSRDVGGVSWFFWSCGASVGFLTRYDRELREPLVWCHPGSSCGQHVQCLASAWFPASQPQHWSQYITFRDFSLPVPKSQAVRRHHRTNIQALIREARQAWRELSCRYPWCKLFRPGTFQLPTWCP